MYDVSHANSTRSCVDSCDAGGTLGPLCGAFTVLLVAVPCHTGEPTFRRFSKNSQNRAPSLFEGGEGFAGAENTFAARSPFQVSLLNTLPLRPPLSRC